MKGVSVFWFCACLGVLGLLLWLTASGCNGIDYEGHVRPAKPDEAKPEPPPPKDDWAPPWFRRKSKTEIIGHGA